MKTSNQRGPLRPCEKTKEAHTHVVDMGTDVKVGTDVDVGDGREGRSPHTPLA